MMNKKWWIVLCLLGVKLSIIAGLILYVNQGHKPPKLSSVQSKESKVAAPIKGALETTSYVPVDSKLPKGALEAQLYDLVLGRADAPVTIIEYSSLACPHCAFFHREIYPKIKAEFVEKGIVRYIYRDFPTNQAAMTAAMLAFCSGPKREVWLQTLFQNQHIWAYSYNFREILLNIVELGEMREGQRCIDNKELEEAIWHKAYTAVKEYSIDATPMFFINGQPLHGGESYEVITRRVQEALQEIEIQRSNQITQTP